MDKLRNLSGITKANVLAILIFAIIAFVGHFFFNHMWVAAKYGLALLIAQALTTALNDPEAEEPLPVWLRASIGYGVGVLFWVGMLLIDIFITSKLVYQLGK